MKTIGLLMLMSVLGLCSCRSLVHSGGKSVDLPTNGVVMLAPFANATENPHAADALTRLAGSTLLERGVPLYQTEETPKRDATAEAPDAGAFLKIARDANAQYLVAGTVHEYRYKTDLRGNPAVGITLRVVDVSNGRTVWQGSTSKVGHGYASLTSTAQDALRDLVARLRWR